MNLIVFRARGLTPVILMTNVAVKLGATHGHSRRDNVQTDAVQARAKALPALLYRDTPTALQECHRISNTSPTLVAEKIVAFLR